MNELDLEAMNEYKNEIESLKRLSLERNGLKKAYFSLKNCGFSPGQIRLIYRLAGYDLNKVFQR